MLGLLLGIVFRGTALAIGLGLVWLLVLENLVRGVAGLLGFFDTLQKGLPGVNAGSIVAALDAQGGSGGAEGTGTPGVAAVVGGGQGTLVVAAYLVVFALVAGLVLQRRDVT